MNKRFWTCSASSRELAFFCSFNAIFWNFLEIMIAVIILKNWHDLLIARNFLMDYYGLTPRQN